MNRNILIISQERDEHVNILQKHLKNRRVNVFRLDTDRDFPRGFTMKIVGSEVGVNWEINGSSTPIDLFDVESVWFRKPIPPKITKDHEIPQETSEFIEKESKEWLKSICCMLDHAFWVNNLFDLQRANRKILQLREASRVGLKIPSTLISDDPEEVKSFYRSHGGRIIAKTFRAQFLEDKEGSAILPRTQRVSFSDLDCEGFYSCPCIIQEEIRRSCEIRVVAIGSELYSFRIQAKNKDDPSDIRSLSREDLQHSTYALSSVTKERLLKLLQRFNLSFASLDMVVTPEGEEIFLELNPNGQWYWLEILTGEPLAERFCDLLIEGLN